MFSYCKCLFGTYQKEQIVLFLDEYSTIFEAVVAASETSQRPDDCEGRRFSEDDEVKPNRPEDTKQSHAAYAFFIVRSYLISYFCKNVTCKNGDVCLCKNIIEDNYLSCY